MLFLATAGESDLPAITPMLQKLCTANYSICFFLIYGAAKKSALNPLELILKHLLLKNFGLKKHDSVNGLKKSNPNSERALFEGIIETNSKEVETWIHLEEINLIITLAEIQLLSKMSNKAKSIKSSNNKVGNNGKSISFRVRKCLKAMLNLEPSYAQHIRELENPEFQFFFFSTVRNYIQGNADLLSLFY